MAETRILTTVYEHEDHVSFDKYWIRNVSGNKCESTQRQVLVTQEEYDEIVERSKIRFNYEYYANLVEYGLDNVAETYMDTMHKDVHIDGDYVTDAEHLAEIIEWDFDNELTIITKGADLK